MWFKNLTGFEENGYNETQSKLSFSNGILKSKTNDKTYYAGHLEIVSLNELRNKVKVKTYSNISNKVTEIVGNVQELHKNVNNTNALFQAASQFNLLEMVGPHITPNIGVDIYERDFTQGPACAISCGAGTIFRNYLIEIEGIKGQTFEHQINCLDDIGDYFNNKEKQVWNYSNGYVLPTIEGINTINNTLNSISDEDRDLIKSKLKIGIQWNTEVTISENKQRVSQIYCSALPVSYSNIESSKLETFARLILEATYEATIIAGILNYSKFHCNKIFLTLVGGGAFGNGLPWIQDAILKALNKYKKYGLDIGIVSYSRPQVGVQKIIEKYYE